ncbi:MAG: hypothetical protein MJ208_04180, partial [Bacilli bacterium]|nr:hypothetical protein [Bacilli bacterium]
SIIHRNRVEFELAVQRIEQEITDDGDEGFKKDGSFFQHGKQNQTMSNYGRSVIRLANLLTLIDKTSRHFSLEKLKILTRYILKGISRGTFKGYNNYLETGREYARGKGYGESSPYLGLEKYLELPDLPARREFENFVSKLKVGRPTFNGITYFADSKLVTLNLDGLYIAFEGSDPNIVNTECVNGENKLGLNLSYGTNTCVMDEGDEYNNIAPLWDYAYLPGTTSFAVNGDYPSNPSIEEQEEWLEESDEIIKKIVWKGGISSYNDSTFEKLLPESTPDNDYVYSAHEDKNNNVVCLMQRSCHHQDNNFTVTAIACEDGMFLMGADLKYAGKSSEFLKNPNPEIHTTIEQCHYKGNDNFVLSEDGKELIHGNALYTIYDEEDNEDKKTIEVRGLKGDGSVDYEVHGDWGRNRGVETATPEPEPATGKVLLAYINHGQAFSNGTPNVYKYAYSIRPKSYKELYEDREFKLLRNFDNNVKVQEVELPHDKGEEVRVAIASYGNYPEYETYTGKKIKLEPGDFVII